MWAKKFIYDVYDILLIDIGRQISYLEKYGFYFYCSFLTLDIYLRKNGNISSMEIDKKVEDRKLIGIFLVKKKIIDHINIHSGKLILEMNKD